MNKERVANLTKQLLLEIDPEGIRPGTEETPNRVARAYTELFDGYSTNIDKIFKAFDGEGLDQIVALRDISFTSFCEHHMLPFSGFAHIAYLPNGKVIGASKLARLTNAFAHRLQIQERMTEQIANTLNDKLEPLGVAVIIEATHLCIKCRGVRSEYSNFVTSVMLGQFREDNNIKQEVLALLNITRK
jgi:GTP cyclohydrolase I